MIATEDMPPVELPPSPTITIIADDTGPFCANRKTEWTAVIGFSLFGLQTVMWPQSIKMSASDLILNILPSEMLAGAALLIAWSRGYALYMNGHLGPGPWIRTIGAAIGCLFMVSMATALALQAIQSGRPPSPGIPFYLALMWAEFSSAKRAARDVRHREL